MAYWGRSSHSLEIPDQLLVQNLPDNPLTLDSLRSDIKRLRSVGVNESQLKLYSRLIENRQLLEDLQPVMSDETNLLNKLLQFGGVNLDSSLMVEHYDGGDLAETMDELYTEHPASDDDPLTYRKYLLLMLRTAKTRLLIGMKHKLSKGLLATRIVSFAMLLKPEWVHFELKADTGFGELSYSERIEHLSSQHLLLQFLSNATFQKQTLVLQSLVFTDARMHTASEKLAREATRAFIVRGEPIKASAAVEEQKQHLYDSLGSEGCRGPPITSELRGLLIFKALFRTELVRDILQTDEYKELCFKPYLKDQAEQYFTNDFERLEMVGIRTKLEKLGGEETVATTMIVQDDLDRLSIPMNSVSFKQALVDFFSYCVHLTSVNFSNNIKLSLLSKRLLDTPSLIKAATVKQTTPDFEAVDLFRIACSAVVELGFERELSADPIRPSVWNQEKYGGNNVWTARIGDRCTISYVELSDKLVNFQNLKPPKQHKNSPPSYLLDPTIFYIEISAHTPFKVVELLLQFGLFPQNKETVGYRYELKVIGRTKPSDPTRVDLLYNKYRYKKLIDQTSPKLKFGSSQNDKDWEVDMLTIKKYITLLVYEKVPDTS